MAKPDWHTPYNTDIDDSCHVDVSECAVNAVPKMRYAAADRLPNAVYADEKNAAVLNLRVRYEKSFHKSVKLDIA